VCDSDSDVFASLAVSRLAPAGASAAAEALGAALRKRGGAAEAWLRAEIRGWAAEMLGGAGGKS